MLPLPSTQGMLGVVGLSEVESVLEETRSSTLGRAGLSVILCGSVYMKGGKA